MFAYAHLLVSQAGFKDLVYLFLLEVVLCFYLLPAFSAALKVRSKKLAQIDSIANSTSVVSSSASNLLFFETEK